jgi:hypothetical protein
MGITTAMAIVPAGERPPELDDDFPRPALRAAFDEDEEEAVLDVREDVLLVIGLGVGVLMTVTTTVEGGIDTPLDVVGATYEVENEVDGGTEEAVTTEVTGGGVDVVVGVVAIVVVGVLVVSGVVVVNGVDVVKGVVVVSGVVVVNGVDVSEDMMLGVESWTRTVEAK